MIINNNEWELPCNVHIHFMYNLLCITGFLGNIYNQICKREYFPIKQRSYLLGILGFSLLVLSMIVHVCYFIEYNKTDDF